MPRIDLPCSDCGKLMQRGLSSAPEGQAKCNTCRQLCRDNGCEIEGCDRPVLGRGLCAPHYSAWHRRQLKYTITCPECSGRAQVDRPSRKYCSGKCSAIAANRAWQLALASRAPLEGPKPPRPPIRPTLKQCGWCNVLHTRSGTYCSATCVSAANHDRGRTARSTLRAAVEDGDHDAVIAEVRRKSAVTGAGCWQWAGQLKDGYPVARGMAVHRLVLEAKHRQALGTQAAHQACANTACVNPDHLQPVTHRENTAEMLARHSYLNRIKELEAALLTLDPNHPLLDMIPVE